jgi:hypothetical protein
MANLKKIKIKKKKKKMYENLCGNCVGGVEMSELTFHMRGFD